MVVDLLPSQTDPRGQGRRRGGRGQFGEESASHRLQGHRRRRRIIDDLDVEHEEILSLTTFIVKHDPKLPLQDSNLGHLIQSEFYMTEAKAGANRSLGWQKLLDLAPDNVVFNGRVA